MEIAAANISARAVVGAAAVVISHYAGLMTVPSGSLFSYRESLNICYPVLNQIRVVQLLTSVSI
jgi:hypothetical protein